MKFTGISRPIDELGRIVIPKEMRKALDLGEKEMVDIYMDGTTIVLKKKENKCVFCGSETELIDVDDKYICMDCAKKIGTLAF